MADDAGKGIDASNIRGTATPINLVSFSGAIDTSGDKDWYRFSVDGATTATFKLYSNDPNDSDQLWIELYRDNGLYAWKTAYLIAPTNEPATLFNVSLEPQYVYYMRIYEYAIPSPYGWANPTFSYNVDVQINTLPPPPSNDIAGNTGTTASISVGGSATSSIGTIGDQDWFRVSLTAGHQYQFDLLGSPTGQGTLADPYLRLLNGSGGEIIAVDDGGVGWNSLLIYTPSQSGTFFLSAQGYSSYTGSYTLTATDLGGPPPPPPPPPPPSNDIAGNTGTTASISVGGSATSSIGTIGDQDWFRVSLTAGHQYQFDLLGSPTGQGTLADPYLRLLNGSGGEIIAVDDGGVGWNSLLTHTPSQSGTFYLSAQGYSSYTGSYTLTATDLGGPPPQTSYSIAPTSAVVEETTGATVTFTITRSGGYLPDDTIYASTVNTPYYGDPPYATNVDDYDGFINREVYFRNGATIATVTVEIFNDSDPEGNETFGFIIQEDPIVLPTPYLDSSTFTILANDQTTPPPGSTIFGSPNDDVFVSFEGGFDSIFGMGGVDTAIYGENRGQYVILSDQLPHLTVIRDADTAQILTDVERLHFVDTALAFDIEGNAGQAYRVYQAAFDRVPDQEGLGYWISALDNGFGLLGVAACFIQSAEFQATYGAPDTVSNQQFITLLYANVLDRAPDQGGLEYWLNDMDHGFSREAVLACFSESAENKQNVIGVIQDGIEYIPW